MTDKIAPAQLRGARGMLDWSMVDLAKAAGVSVSVVKRAEHDGPIPVADEPLHAMQDALEAKGVRFLDDDGDGLGLRVKP